MRREPGGWESCLPHDIALTSGEGEGMEFG